LKKMRIKEEERDIVREGGGPKVGERHEMC